MGFDCSYNSMPGIPYALSIFHIFSREIESNAFEKSTNVVMRGICLSLVPSIILCSVCICSSQLIPRLNPA